MTIGAPALLLLLLAGGPSPLASDQARVEVRLLGRSPPRAATLRAGGRVIHVAAAGGRLLVDGRPASAPLALDAAAWRVEVEGEPLRAYQAALEVRAEGSALRLDAGFALERYVEAVVASEAAPNTPPAALAALAVVVRSWALAARGRHAGGGRCDLAHCQVLRGDLRGRAHLAAAAAAAHATAGVVLRLPGGEVAAAPFHAACGGHTADPALAFGGGGTGAAPVADPGCPELRWRARLSPDQVSGALRAALVEAGWPAPGGSARGLRAGDLSLLAGPGGWVAQVASADGRWRLSGDAAARALDAALGRGQVRSTRFQASDEGAWVVLRGQGHGHGVGLCQEGATRRALAGATWRAILAAYFPGAGIG